MTEERYGTDISALIREALLNAVNGAIPYEDVERIARVFVNDRLAEADTIIASEGRMFTRTGKLHIVQELDWCIFFGLRTGLEGMGFVSWKATEIALAAIDIVNEHMGEDPAWLTLLDGKSFVRCYRVGDTLLANIVQAIDAAEQLEKSRLDKPTEGI